jgi:Zn-dependent peptidase ImmA (M78 family)
MNNIESKPRIGFARELARKCIKQHSLTPPILINELLTEIYGFKIVYLDIDSNISALVDLDDHYIGINKNHHIHRQRFTLAHELGHFCLNHKERKFTEYVVTPGKERSILETEANEFSAELLIPLTLLKKLSRESNVSELCSYFQVSKEALFYQMMKHKLI